MLRQAEDHLHDLRDLAVGLLGRQELIPVLQQVAELAFGQLQPGVERHSFDGLPLARAIDRAVERELAEDGLQQALVSFLQPLQRATVRQSETLAHVASSLQREKPRVELPAQRQQLAEQLFLDDVRRRCLPRRAFDELPQLCDR